MKKIFLIVVLLIVYFASFAQNPPFIYPRSSPYITVQDSRLRALYNFYFPHLHGLTLNGGTDTLGMVMYEDSSSHIWYRDTVLSGGHKWTMILKIGDAVSGVASFNTRTGAVTLSSGDVVTALGYTPVNPNGTSFQYIAGDGSKVTFPTIPAQINITDAGLFTHTGTYPNYTFNVSTPNQQQVFSSGSTLNQNNFWVTGSNVLGITGTAAFGLPTGSTSQRPSSPGVGYFRYNTDSSATETWNGSVWVKTGTGTGVTGVTSFNTRTGIVTLTSGDVTGALGFTPYNSTNPIGYISNITGLISAGANISITGSGTSGSPYVIVGTGGGGGGNTNSNVGTGYRWAVPNTNNIKTFSPFSGFILDSITNPNALTFGTNLNGILGGNGTGIVAAVTVNSPLTFVANTLGIQTANASLSGAISNTDWNTFNSKQSALTFQQSISNVSNVVNLQNDLSTTPSLGDQYNYGFDSTGTRNFYLNKYIVAKKTTEIRSLRSGDTSLIYRTIINKVVSDFYYDPSDSTTADDSVMVIASANGKRFKRFFNRALYPEWWGATGNNSTNDGPAFNKLFRWMEANVFGSFEVRFLHNNYYTSDTIKLPRLLQSLPNNNHPSVLISGYGVTIRTDKPICIFHRMPTSLVDAGTINDAYRLSIEGLYFQGDRGISRGQTAIYISCLYGVNCKSLYMAGFDTCMVGRFLTKPTISDCFFLYESVGFEGASLMDIFFPGDTHTVSATAFNHGKILNNRFFADGQLPAYSAVVLLGHDGCDVSGNIIEGVGPKYCFVDDWQNTNTSGRTFYDNNWLEATGTQTPVDFLIKDGEVCRISNLKTTYADTLFDASQMAPACKVILDNVSYGNGFAPIAFKGDGAGNTGQQFRCLNCDLNLANTLNNSTRWSSGVAPFNLVTEYFQGANLGYEIATMGDIHLRVNIKGNQNNNYIWAEGNLFAGIDNNNYWGGFPGFNNFRPTSLGIGTQGLFIDTLAKIKWTTPALNNGQTVALSVPKRNVLAIESNGAVKLPYGITSQQPAADTAYFRMNRDSNSLEFVDTTKTYQEIASKNWVRNNFSSSGSSLFFANGLTFTAGDSVYGGGILNQPLVYSGAGFSASFGTSGSNLGGFSILGGKYNNAQGAQFLGSTSTINNALTASSGSVSNFSAYAFLAPTITSTNTGITYAHPSTVFIDAIPTMGTNSTASSNPYALNVNSGFSHFGLGTSNITAGFDGSVWIGTTGYANTTFLGLGASTSSTSSMRIISGSDVTSPAQGDTWFNGTNLYFEDGGSNKRDLLNGIHNYVHSIFTPATGGTVNLIANNYNIINPSGAIATLTVNLPSSPVNNDIVYIKYTQAVTTVTYGNGTVVDGITNPSAGGLVVLTFDSGTSSWY